MPDEPAPPSLRAIFDESEELFRRENPDSDDPYFVVATPWERGWELAILGVGATQTSDEDGVSAEDMVRDYLHTMRGGPPERFRIRIDYRDAPATGDQV